MNLTSWRRARYFLGGNTPLTDDAVNKRKFLSWIPAISRKIEEYLNRDLELKSHTEYFDTLPKTIEYPVRNFPITVLTSVKSDSTGEFTGSETTESDTYIGSQERSICLQTPVIPAKRGLEVVYTGGLAASGTQSTFTIENEGSEAFVAGVFAEGQTSGAMGYVISKTLTTIVIEVLYGRFEVGEQIAGSATETGSKTADQTADIASADVRCIAEEYTDLTVACELEIRYMNDHRGDYENFSTSRGSQSRRANKFEHEFLPEVASILDRYRNIHV